MATVKYTDILGVDHFLDTKTGDTPGSEVVVHALRTAVEASINALGGAVSASKVQVDVINATSIVAALNTIDGHVDGTEAALSSIKTATEAVSAIISASKLAVADATAATKLDTLHTDLATTLAGKLDTLHTDLGTTLAGYLDGVEGKLDLLIPAASGGTQDGYVGSIGTGADVSFASQTLRDGMFIKNESAAGQIIYYSKTAAPTSTTAPSLLPGETRWIYCTNANTLKFRTNTSSTGAMSYSGQ